MQLYEPFDLFSLEQCQELLSQVSALRPARVMGGSTEGIRTNRVSWLEPSQELSDQVWEAAGAWHEQFELAWMQKPFQISCYEPGEFYTWHQDDYNPLGRKSMRALSLTATLATTGSAGVGFESGDCDLAQGQAVFFPSSARHHAYNRGSGPRWAFTVWFMRRL